MRLDSITRRSAVRRAPLSFFVPAVSARSGQQLDSILWSLSSDIQRVRPGDSAANQLTATIREDILELLR